MGALFRGTRGAASVFGLVLIAAVPALAESAPPVFPCGRVTAFTAPTATAAGSIQLGTTTFVLAAGSLPSPPPPIAVGAITCLSGEQNAAGEFLATMNLVGDTVCGTSTAFTAASATQTGNVTLMGKRSVIIPVRAGASLSGAQVGRDQCFTFGFNATGDAEIVGFVGPVPTANVPGPTARAVPGQLPNTSTDQSGASPVLMFIVIATLSAGASAVARRHGAGSGH